MEIKQPHFGLVIKYGYLWRRESLEGRENAAKDRPCAVVIILDDSTVKVAPITHTEPDDLSQAIEIPAKTRARLGLDSERSWVICSELNEFKWPGPDLAIIKHTGTYEYGTLPDALFQQIKKKIEFLARGRKFNVVRTN